MAFKVFVDGQEGTTGLHLLDYLSQRDDVELLRTAENKRKDSVEHAKFLNTADVAFLCLPDVASREAVSLVNNPNTCITNASTASRMSDDWVYGLPELAQGQHERLRNAKCIVVPGCHASAFVLLMRPLVNAGIVPADYPVTAFLLTGYNGGGGQMIAGYLAVNNPKLDNPHPYVLALAYKHLPEMRVQSKLLLAPIFTPVVDNSLRGLAVTIGLHLQHLARKASPVDIARVLADYYQDKQFIRMTPADNVATPDNGFFDVQDASDTNHTDLFIFGSDERMAVTARLDNLGKGAAGAVVRCINVHLGVDETASLHVEAPVPVAGAEHTVREAAPDFAS